MTIMRRWLTAALALLLLMTSTGLAENFADWFFEEETPSEGTGWEDWDATPEPLILEITPAPTTEPPVCALEDDGQLRVWLRSLNDPQELNLTLNGVYAVEGDRGFRFEPGAQLTLTAQDGEVWLSTGGLTLDMGAALTLTRHLDGWGEAGGIAIEEAEKPTLYCGDLSVSAGQNGLKAVLNIQIEDYLKGVVAYEMSDSFPLEALKAQAVAARTYAMQRKWSAGRKDYDVVDTTADQVFKGYDPTYINVSDAVDQTRGLVGIYDGTFASCYYTASNGGQTALAGQILGDASADGYLTMRDDPYDLENARSLENDLTVTAKCEGSLKLRGMLTDALKDVMADAGFDEGTWEFDSIAAIEPVSPRFEGSRLFDKLAFDLHVRVAESTLETPEPSDDPEPTPSPETTDTPVPNMDEAPETEKWVVSDNIYRVTIDIFDDIKDGLSLGLNGTDCELTTVEKVSALDGGDAYRLVMRRFGHGVGMSQRGAQTMAGAHGKSFMDILGFYYPGVTVERMAWPDSPLKALPKAGAARGASRPRPTPLPTPAPLPALVDGERYATVTATTLNLRQQPSTTARIVDILEQGSRLIVSGEADDEGWVPVHTAELEGYVKEEYLEQAE